MRIFIFYDFGSSGFKPMVIVVVSFAFIIFVVNDRFELSLVFPDRPLWNSATTARDGFVQINDAESTE